jgi:BirA family biotin operon repressor/biotin-[acetyl-CoA-carboxylase] ligase
VRAARNSPDSQPSDVVIVRELLSAGEGFVSGSLLAEQLGVSRVAVWAQMEKLRTHGFTVEAVRRRGYRLIEQPSGLDELLLRASLDHRGNRPAVYFFDSVDSTNSEAERLLAGGAETPFVVITKKQEKGRGRLGRRWESDDVGNLYASFAFRPQLQPARMQDFTLWMGVNVCEALANVCRLDVGVKWPNDILHNGRKLGGMLTEARIDSDRTRDVVFGLGLNINSQRNDWPDAIKTQTTSVAEALGRKVDVNQVATTIISRVFKAYESFIEETHRERFTQLWKRFDLLNGRRIAVRFGDVRVEGIVEGLDRSGALQLRDQRGIVHRCLAGDVTIEKSPV